MAIQSRESLVSQVPTARVGRAMPCLLPLGAGDVKWSVCWMAFWRERITPVDCLMTVSLLNWKLRGDPPHLNTPGTHSHPWSPRATFGQGPWKGSCRYCTVLPAVPMRLPRLAPSPVLK